jgi:hypothetical protein
LSRRTPASPRRNLGPIGESFIEPKDTKQDLRVTGAGDGGFPPLTATAITPPERDTRWSKRCSAQLQPWPGIRIRPFNRNPDVQRSLVGARDCDRH